MTELRRVIDKFSGKKFCDLTDNEQAEYMGAVARRGAIEALRTIGLDDENAISDLKDLRDLLKGVRAVRAVRHMAWVTALKGIGKLIGYVGLLFLAREMLKNPAAQKIADQIMP